MIHRAVLQSSSLRPPRPPHTSALVHSASLGQKIQVCFYKYEGTVDQEQRLA